MKEVQIKKYKIHEWFNSKKMTIEYGIDVVLENGMIYHCKNGKKAVMYKDKTEAATEIKRLNQELTN
jgi:hypothetical protein